MTRLRSTCARWPNELQPLLFMVSFFESLSVCVRFGDEFREKLANELDLNLLDIREKIMSFFLQKFSNAFECTHVLINIFISTRLNRLHTFISVVT